MKPEIEILESRTLLSAQDPFLTIIIHGQDELFNPFDRTSPQWATDLGEAMSAKFSPTSVDRIIVFGWNTFLGINTLWTESKRLATTVTENINELYWLSEGKGVDLHLVGFSRGAVLTSEAIRILDGSTELSQKIDRFQVTTLDFHPDDIFFKDPFRAWSNASIFDFWENYYQTTGGQLPPFLTGYPIDGTQNHNLTSLVQKWDSSTWYPVDFNHSEIYATIIPSPLVPRAHGLPSMIRGRGKSPGATSGLETGTISSSSPGRMEISSFQPLLSTEA